MGNKAAKVNRVAGDTNTPITAVLRQGGRAVDTSSMTVTFYAINTSDESVTVSYSAASSASAVVFTADASTDKLTSVNHGLERGDEVVLTTDDTLPAGLALATTYWVVGVADDTFKVSATKNGTPVDVTDAGTGPHYFRHIGKVSYTPTTGEVAEANVGTHMCAFRVENGGAYDHFPHDQTVDDPKFTLVINSVTT